MHWRFPLSLTAAWLTSLAVAADFAQPAANPLPWPLEVRGLTAVPGFKCAFFYLNSAGASLPGQFFISEGEARYGIRVVAIDPQKGRVRIEYAGHQQDLLITDAPASAVNSDAAGNSLVANLDSPAEVAAALELAEKESAVEAKKTQVLERSELEEGGRRSGANPNVPANSNGPDPANALKSQANEQWYQDALVVEQSRQADAQAVLAGEQTPWPRTPLTPAGTPSALVGNETFWPNHIAGFNQH